MSFLKSFAKSVRSRPFFAMSSALVMVAGMMFGANIATADSVWVQSYERSGPTQVCEAQPGETPWQESWGTDSSWSPSWETWANNGNGGWVCTRSITWARTPVAPTNASSDDPVLPVTCTEPVGGADVDCAVGKIGPGNGLVFYDAGSVQPWGRYLEMAPKTWSGGSGDPVDDWCSDITNSVATGTAVGTGSANTTAMLTNASPFVACTASAANAVRVTIDGFTDWFLPSKDELNAMYTYSQVVGFNALTYGFASGSYWSSSQDSPTNLTKAWSENLGVGVQGSVSKDFTLGVRPVRAF